jgi:hypothetical protein
MDWLILLAQAAENAPTDVDGGWAAWLKEYGGWAISVVLAGVIVGLVRYILTKLENKPPSAEQKRIEREAAEAAQKKIYDQVHGEMFDKLHDELVPLITAIEQSKAATDELKAEAKKLFEETVAEKNRIITELARQKDQVGDEAMKKMEELYKQMLGLMEKVIGAAESLGQVEKRLKAMEGDQSAPGAST